MLRRAQIALSRVLAGAFVSAQRQNQAGSGQKGQKSPHAVSDQALKAVQMPPHNASSERGLHLNVPFYALPLCEMNVIIQNGSSDSKDARREHGTARSINAP